MPARYLIVNKGLDAYGLCLICLNLQASGFFIDIYLSLESPRMSPVDDSLGTVDPLSLLQG